MRVLHISFSDTGGGANRSAMRLHNALRTVGIDSKALVTEKNGSDPNVVGPKTISKKVVHKFSSAVEVGASNLIKGLFQIDEMCSVGLFPSQLKSEIKNLNPDIINLHFINSGALAIQQIKTIEYPVVWTLHDCWPLSGLEHIPILDRSENIGAKCTRWKLFRQLSRMVKSLKGAAFSKIKFVAPSLFIKSEVQKYGLNGVDNVTYIPNPVDTSFWKPENKKFSRDLLGISHDEHIVLCCIDGRLDGFNAKIKGYHLVQSFFERLNRLEKKIKVLIIGKTNIVVPTGENVSAVYLNRLSDDIALKIVYSSANCLVHFSLWENLPNTVIESLACGVPAVAFDQTGSGEIIEHLKTGYLAENGNVDDLIIGVNNCLQNAGGINGEETRCLCVKSVQQRFSSKLVAERYFQYYQTILGNKSL